MKTSLSRRAAFCALLAGTCLSAPAVAQSAGSISPPPVRNAIDDNGVDVLRGTFNISQTDVSIGGSGHHGLSYRRFAIDGRWSSDAIATLNQVGTVITVTVEGVSDSFTVSGTSYVPTEANGASLKLAGGVYTYTSRDGIVVVFQSNSGEFYSFYKASLARVSTITYPDGTSLTYTYKTQTYCGAGYEGGVCQSQPKTAVRLSSITNSNGYQLKFAYAYNGTELTASNFSDWAEPTSVTAINNAVEYCDPTADSCTLANSWPAASYTKTLDGSLNETRTVADALGRTTRYTRNSTYTDLRMKRPGATSDNLIVAYGANGVSSVTRDGVAYSYSYADSGTTRTTTVTDPFGHSRIYVGDTSTNRLSSVTDETAHTTSYAYDANGRMTQITAPEGNYSVFTYDARGNVKQTDLHPKAGSGLATISTYAGFDLTCVNPKTCNKPNTTTDAGGNVTDYTYDATHGGVLTVTLPAPTTGAVRPQSRYSYTGQQAYYRQWSGGSPAASGQTTWLPTGTSACQTNASCTGTADEVKTTISFGPQSAGTANNLLPVSISSGAGDGSLTATTAVTYDNVGNGTYVDGPLAGSADTTRTIYDAARQVVGVIGPDPDGAGALKNRASRLTYNADGQVTLAEQGTTVGQTDGAWAAFSSLQQVQAAYDANARKTSDALTAAGTTYGLTQYTYDSLGRLDCTAVRMNPSVFASVAPSCSLGTAGSYGNDRITKASYDYASRLTETTSAYGTAEAGSDGAITFTANGKPQTFTDGEGHVTTYEYDGFDRPLKTRFPNASGSGSSTTDYEQLTYGDPRSLVTSRRLRDGQTIGFSYDNLGRQTYMDLSGSGIDLDITYGYDLLGRLKTSSNPAGHLTNYGYDALGRVVSEGTTYGGTHVSQYDLAGRRTRFTWADGLYVNYDRLVTGEVSAIRENGAVSGAGVLASYSYDDLGRRTLISRGNGTTTGYSYDPVSRLSDLSQDLAGTANDLHVTFGYNPAGQITNRTADNTAYSYTGTFNQDLVETSNGLNQLTAQGATALGYDGRGNVTAIGANAFTYGQRNQLVTAAGKTLFYDPPGRLDLIHDGVNGTTFDFDGSNLVTEGTYSTGAIQRRYVPGDGMDEPVVWYEGSGTATRRWLHADERGSIVAVSDASGNVVGINKYDEYGQPQGTLTGRFGYTGQAWLPEVGLAYYKARMYHPLIGRFMQTDPIAYSGGQNVYGYVAGDPTNLADSAGTNINVPLDSHVRLDGIDEAGTGSNIAGHSSVSAAIHDVGFSNPYGGDTSASSLPGYMGKGGTIVVQAPLGGIQTNSLMGGASFQQITAFGSFTVPDNGFFYDVFQSSLAKAKFVHSALKPDRYAAEAAQRKVLLEAIRTGTMFLIDSRPILGSILLQAPWRLGGKQGIVEYIMPMDKGFFTGSPEITHARFIPGAPVSGYANNWGGKQHPAYTTCVPPLCV